ncbi:MAG: asparagine synthase (glutamine-hydrolyzing), partial [bacterium]
MCGICGIIYKNKSRQVAPDLLRRMTDALIHRGPDDSGVYLDGPVGIGHRRLSIVDVAGGHQPLADPQQRYWLSYNGETYNHLEVRAHLEAQGYQYRTRCDTETVLYAMMADGAAALHRLRGFFAFGFYDTVEKKLTIARDRLGIKPLYYLDTPELFAFASEIKSLLQVPSYRAEVDQAALYQTLALKYTCDNSTLFAGVRKLLPGHYLELQDGVISVVRYWDFDHLQADENLTEADAIARFRELFDESVRMRLMADVPLGMFLSGGIDSSVIASRMATMVDRPIATFSVAFAEREANELEYARLAAKHAGADQHEVTMTTPEFFELLPRLIYHEDEPIAHPSSVALYVVARLAAEHVKVVLTGEGSDELLGGYERYYQTLYNLKADRAVFGILPRALKRGFFRPLIDSLPYKFPYRNKAVRTFLYLDSDIETIFLDNYATFARPQLGALLGEGNSIAAQTVYRGFTDHFQRSGQQTLLGKLLYADIKTYLLELLMKQDQMSMAASIESRVPFLDHELVEFAFTLPDKLKIKGFNTKRLLRLALGDQIPTPILTRRKAGFPVPIAKWFREEYHNTARDFVLAADSFCLQHFDRRQIEQYFDLHRSGKYN